MADSITIGRLTLARPLLVGRAAAGFGGELAGYGVLRSLGAIITPPIALQASKSQAVLCEPARLPGLMRLPRHAPMAFDQAMDRALLLPAEALEKAGCMRVVTLHASTQEECLRLADRLGDVPAVDGLLLAASELKWLGTTPAALRELVEALRAESEGPLLVELDAATQQGDLDALKASGADGCMLGSPIVGDDTVIGPALMPRRAAALRELSGANLGCIVQGGASDAQDVLDLLVGGAVAVALDHGLLAHPAGVRDIAAALRDALRSAGVSSWRELGQGRG